MGGAVEHARGRALLDDLPVVEHEDRSVISRTTAALDSDFDTTVWL
jgi:hypothetical protein